LTNWMMGAERPGMAVCAKLMSRLTEYSSGLNITGIRSPVTVLVTMAFSNGMSAQPLALPLGDDALVDGANHLVGDPSEIADRKRKRGRAGAAGRRLPVGVGAAPK